MPDALRPEQSDGVPDSSGAGRFASVGNTMESGRSSSIEDVLELRTGYADLRTAQPKPHQAVGSVIESKLESCLGRWKPELPGNVVDQVHREPEVSSRRHPRILDRLGVGLDRHTRIIAMREHRGVGRARQLDVLHLLFG